MNNPLRILQTLDRHLTAPAELTLFGRVGRISDQPLVQISWTVMRSTFFSHPRLQKGIVQKSVSIYLFRRCGAALGKADHSAAQYNKYYAQPGIFL